MRTAREQIAALDLSITKWRRVAKNNLSASMRGRARALVASLSEQRAALMRTLPSAGHCEGCDSEQPDTMEYEVRYGALATPHRVDTTERVRYCGDCAGLVEAGWNEHIVAIAEASPLTLAEA